MAKFPWACLCSRHTQADSGLQPHGGRLVEIVPAAAPLAVADPKFISDLSNYTAMAAKAERWCCSDALAPDYVEFWFRI